MQAFVFLQFITKIGVVRVKLTGFVCVAVEVLLTGPTSDGVGVQLKRTLRIEPTVLFWLPQSEKLL